MSHGRSRCFRERIAQRFDQPVRLRVTRVSPFTSAPINGVIPAFFAARQKRTVPYAPSASVSARAGSFSAAARATRAPGDEAPRRSE